MLSDGRPTQQAEVDCTISTDSRQSARPLLYLTPLVLAILVPIWAPAYFPSQNGPWFLLPTQMFLRYADPSVNYSEYFVRNWHPIPHLLHDALVGLVSLIAPLLVAEKIVLTVNALLLPLSVFALLSVAAPQRRYLGYLSFLMVFSYPFMRGYHDFTLSISLFFLTLAYWLKHRRAVGAQQAAVLGAMSVLVFLSHLFTFALLAGCIGWLRLFESRSWKQAFVSAITATWPGWLLTADYFWLSSQASWLDKSDTQWLPLQWTAQYFFIQFFHTVSDPAFAISVAAWGWIVYFLYRGWRESGLSLMSVIRKMLTHPIGSLIVFLLVAYFVVPYKILGWHKANVRIVPFILGIVLLGVAMLPRLELSLTIKRAFIASVTMASIAVSAFLTPEILRMDAAVQECVSGIEHFEPNSTLLPIRLENPAFGGICPLTRVHEYYHIAKGGANGGSIPSLNTLSVMWYREYPVQNVFPLFEPGNPESLQAISEFYDYVLIMGKDADVERQIEDAGFVVVHEQGRIRLLKNSRPDQETARGREADEAADRGSPLTSSPTAGAPGADRI